MDSAVIATIASTAVSLLVPYLKFIGKEMATGLSQEFGSKAGEAAWDTTKRLYESVKARFSLQPDTKKILDAVEKDPDDDDLKATIRFHLKEIMKSDDAFTKEIASLLKTASENGADTVFNTNISGNVNKLVQMGNVYGDVKI
ncbi:MAG: hypothetical protein KF758_10980 [Anaerolineales bacterium]|nr:hypothetical protein [Anaerolineales bacterium]